MKDDLGDRMKGQYEDRTRFMLPRRTYTILRLDGKAFHTYTRKLKKPFDYDLFEDMDKAIIAMLPEIQGAVFAYTQSDEISVLLTDFASPTTSAWFDGNLQKIGSVAASIITAEFNKLRWKRVYDEEKAILDAIPRDTQYFKMNFETLPIAYFDTRAFTIPDRIEVMNYFIWRNQDCSRNSVSMVAQSNFSHKELQGKSTLNLHDMLHAKGVNWATDFPDGAKNGRLIVKEQYVTEFIPTGFTVTPQDFGDNTLRGTLEGKGVTRNRWVAKGAWKFTEDKDKLLALIPQYA